MTADNSATDVIIVLEVFYRQHFGYMFQILLTLTTQMLGYGIAGICRRWLVYPSSMIWPDLLGTTTLLNTLHNRRNPIADGWTISRYRFFPIRSCRIMALVLYSRFNISCIEYICFCNLDVSEKCYCQSGLWDDDGDGLVADYI